MQRVLLIKLTSLGDLIHALPALTDAANHIPGIEFDWMIDEEFYEIALWHPVVKRLYMTSHRKWRFTQKATYRAIRNLLTEVRKTSYDWVIDGQGNFKTALLACSACGLTAGFDRHSVREWVAHFAYQKQCSASKKAHAIERLRRLFAFTLSYPLPLSPPDFGIQKSHFRAPLVQLPSHYFVFIHNASWKTKLWPEKHWETLIALCVKEGRQIVLPWGNEEERKRAERLSIHPHVHVLPHLSLSEMGYVLSRATACVSMDTGLSHLAAALNIPSVTLYGPTDFGLTGASGEKQMHLQSNLHCAPCKKKTCRYNQEENLCLSQFSPDIVYKKLQSIIAIESQIC